MRLRNIPGAHETLNRHSHVITNPEDYKGRWHAYFNNENPIHIEIGMGKGQFITSLAHQNRGINYIGIEKFTNVLVRGLKKIDQYKDFEHLVVIRMDAEGLFNVFEHGEIDGIYLNFSDPWPKERHDKRRLTHKKFLEIYRTLLSKRGSLQLKTDNIHLFDYSIEQLSEMNWYVREITNDLHNSSYADDNIMTEYEENFVHQGIPICRLKASINEE